MNRQLSAFIEDTLPLVDSALEGCLQVEASVPGILLKAMRHAVFPGGKRFRPLVTVASCVACGGEVSSALSAACAVELIHSYSLVHDDLPAMDDDDTRRGAPSVHAAFGEDIAILAGDALLTLAFEVLSSSEKSAAKVYGADAALAATGELARAAGAAGMVAGQVMDMQLRAGASPSREYIYRMHRGKTAALIAAAAACGGIAACAGQREIEALREYGEHTGLAFQAADDIEDGDADSGGNIAVESGVEVAVRTADDHAGRAVAALESTGMETALLKELARYAADRGMVPDDE